MSWEEDDDVPAMPPLPKMALQVQTLPTEHDQSATMQSASPIVASATDSRTAPSFVEFSKNMQKRREDGVSPFSVSSMDDHRQAALDALEPVASPDMSPHDGLAFQTSDPFFPRQASPADSKSDESNALPMKLDLDNSNSVLEPQEAARQAQAQHLEAPNAHDSLDLSTPYPEYEDEPVENLSDERQSETYKSIGEVSQHKVKETLQPPSLTREDKRIISYAAEKYPAMKTPQSQKSSWRNSGIAAAQKASSLANRISLTSRKNSDKSRYSQTEDVHYERQRAVPPTPYQLYGAAIFKTPSKKKKTKDRKAQLSLQHRQSPPFEGQEYPRRMNRAQTMPNAEETDQTKQRHLSSAFQKLKKSQSKKRRERLKQSIVLVGPVSSSRDMKDAPSKPAGPWV